MVEREMTVKFLINFIIITLFNNIYIYIYVVEKYVLYTYICITYYFDKSFCYQKTSRNLLRSSRIAYRHTLCTLHHHFRKPSTLNFQKQNPSLRNVFPSQIQILFITSKQTSQFRTKTRSVDIITNKL